MTIFRQDFFLEIEKEYSEYDTSKFVVIPCPHEASVSYGGGTKKGPKAIIDAAYYVETFDEELKKETYQETGIFTTKPVSRKKLGAVVDKTIKDKKVPIILGGEHSISPFAVKAAAQHFPKLSVLQFDAHADLRDEYHGDKNSHACATRRILDICPAVQVGIRSLSIEEYQFAESSDQLKRMHFAASKPSAEKIVSELSEQVFITFDVDVFDPSIMPSTGTPEPGGLLWNEVLNILRLVSAKRKVVGADFVELAPMKGFPAPDFMVAKLIYRLMGYLSA